MKRWQQTFIETLSKRGNVSESAAAAGVTRAAAYTARKRDEDFGEAWSEVEEAALDKLETVAFKRATKQSDTLLIFLLKAHRREKYGDCLSINVIKRVQRELEAMDDDDLLAMMGYEQSRESAAG